MRRARWGTSNEGFGIVGAVLLMGSVAGVGVGSPAVADRVSVADLLADPATVVSGPWREQVGAGLRAMPEWQTVRTVTAPVHGTVIAGTVRLPAEVRVNGDVTILADTIEFAGPNVRITAPGHDVRLLPFTRVVRAGAAERQAAADVFEIDTSGEDATGVGNQGFDGSNGSAGAEGAAGTFDPNGGAAWEMKDDRPFGAALRREASNHHMLRKR